MSWRFAALFALLMWMTVLAGVGRAQTTRLLTSGSPASFAYPRVTSPTLFSGDFGFRIDVPASATRLEVRLDVPASAQFAIGLRFGSDFPVGRFDADNGGIGNQNPVVVTTASNPPLREGTYYIGIVIISGTVSGTITATVSSGAPVIAAAASLDFGSVVVGQSKDLSLSVRNTGTAVLTVSTISSSRTQFAVISPARPFNVSTSAEQAVAIRFQPTATGSLTATLTIASNDPVRPSTTVSLSGQGVTGAAIALSTTSLAFSAQTGTNPAPQTFTVRNSGGGTLNYQISTNQPWLSVAPASGSSTGTANTVTVSANTAGLGAGTFNGEARVSQSAAAALSADDPAQAAPAVVAVRLTLTEVASVSAATFARGSLAPESITSAFGQNLAAGTEAATVIPLPTSLAGTTVKVKDSAGTERPAPLFFVSPGQINYLIPEGTRAGAATIAVTNRDQAAGTGTLQVETVAPGLFTANASGRGVAAAVALRIGGDGAQASQLVFRCGAAPGSCTGNPIDLGPPSDQVFLLLFGTGFRGRSSLSAVSATIGGDAAEVLAVSAQGDFVGLDQINLRVPRSLNGRGDVNVVLTVDGKPANTVTVSIGGSLPAPRITSLNPNNAQVGQTISSFSVAGENLASVTGIEFFPAAGNRRE